MNRDAVIEILDYAKRFGGSGFVLNILIAPHNGNIRVEEIDRVAPRPEYLLIDTPSKELYFVPYEAIKAIIYK